MKVLVQAYIRFANSKIRFRSHSAWLCNKTKSTVRFPNHQRYLFPAEKGRTVRRKEPHYPHIVRTWAPTWCSPSTTSRPAHQIYSSRNAQVRLSQRAFRVSRSPAWHVSSSRAKNLLDSDVSRVLPRARAQRTRHSRARVSPVPRAERSAGCAARFYSTRRVGFGVYMQSSA